MNSPWVDLHVHSNTSPLDDGKLSAVELLDMVVQKNGKTGVMAFTPHNSSIDLTALNHHRDIQLIPGTELSCRFRVPSSGENLVVHVIGLGFKKDHPAMQEVFRINQNIPSQNLYTEMILQKLRSIGIVLGTLEEIQAQYPARKVSRMLLAEEAVCRGYASSTAEFLDIYVGDRGKKLAHVRDMRQFICLEQAVDAITQSGGYACLAHCLSYQLDFSDLHALVKRFKSYAGDHAAIETIYGSCTVEQCAFVQKELARPYSLLESVASDYHNGDYNYRFTYSQCSSLLNALGIKGGR